jgi:hypothetical protein
MKAAIIQKLQDAQRMEGPLDRQLVHEAIDALVDPTVFIPDHFELGLIVTGLAHSYLDRTKKLKRAKLGQSPRAYKKNGSPAGLAMELASIEDLFNKVKKITDRIKEEAAARRKVA